MPAYFLAETLKITDQEMYKEYIEHAVPIIRKYGGVYIIKSENLTPFCGDWNIKRIVLIKFENRNKLDNCFQSEEYKKISHLRKNSTESRSIIIDN